MLRSLNFHCFDCQTRDVVAVLINAVVHLITAIVFKRLDLGHRG